MKKIKRHGRNTVETHLKKGRKRKAWMLKLQQLKLRNLDELSKTD